jgi:hypothetical protein
MSRIRSGFDSLGVRAGSFMIKPSVTAGAVYDSNVFATSSNPRGDIAGVVAPSLSVSSQWDRHALDIAGSVRATRYREFSSLDQTDADLRVRGRVDLWHDAAILTNVRLGALHEGVGSITSPTNAVEPTPYSFASADVTYWQQLSRLSMAFGVRADAYDYGSTRAQDGTVINQDSRDGHIHVAHGRLDYVLTGNFGVFTAFEANARNLRGTPTQSISSEGYRSLSGVNFGLTNLLTGEVGAGYARQRFYDPGIGVIEGPAYRAMLTWSASRLLDLHAKIEQIVTEAGDTTSRGVRANAYQIGADYELRRDTVLSVVGIYEQDDFYGAPRNDTVYSGQAELKRNLNRFSDIALRYRYLRRDSDTPSASYDKHEVGLNVTARY